METNTGSPDGLVLPTLSARLDRLPITSRHRTIVLTLAFAYFFELADSNAFSFAAPGVIADWHITTGTIATVASAQFAGMFVGATCGGWSADWMGRKRAFIAAILIYTLGALAVAASWNVPWLVLFRFLTGIGLSGMTVVANTYISEFFPARQRGRFLAIVVTIGLLGIPATAWVARFLVPIGHSGWRFVFIWAALGVLALPLASRMIESPRWLWNRGRRGEAERLIQDLEQRAIAEFGTLPEPEIVAAEAPVRRVPYTELFRGIYRGRTTILLLTWAFQTLGFQGFMTWVPTLLVQHGFSIVRSLTFASIISVCNPVGSLGAAFLIERFERKWLIVGISLFIAASGLLYGMTFEPVLIVLFGAGVVLGVQAFASFLYTYTPELYPTEVRSSGMGFVYGVGRLANVFGPFFVSTLLGVAGYISVFVYIALCWALVAIIIGAFGPRTTGRPLELTGH